MLGSFSSAPVWDQLLSFVLPLSCALGYLVLAPFTKVEESFNLQATHDIIHLGGDIKNYDHKRFPGVVPRTFVGPVFLSFGPKLLDLTVFPFLPEGINTKFARQYATRGFLGLLVSLAFCRYYFAVKKAFCPRVAVFTALITCSQFHFFFYATRTLPNEFAVVLVLLATAFWLEPGKEVLFIAASAAAVILFRGEVLLMVGPMAAITLFVNRTMPFKTFFMWAAFFGLCSLCLTVVCDYYYWGRWMWAEYEVMYFNVVENRSSEWGTLPFQWYFKSALPRLLLTAYPAAIFSILVSKDHREAVLQHLAPVAVHILVFSVLPHKELRFIIYTVPLINTMAAVIFAKLTAEVQGRCYKCVLYLAILGCFFLNAVCTVKLASTSYGNYPGGFALQRLHQISDIEATKVHMDVYTCGTGASRFMQLNENWTYDKTEGLTPAEKAERGFTHLLVETKYVASHLSHFHLLDAVRGYTDWKNFEFPFGNKWKKLIHIMVRSDIFRANRDRYDRSRELWIMADDAENWDNKWW